MLVKGCYAADLFLDIKYIDLYPVPLAVNVYVLFFSVLDDTEQLDCLPLPDFLSNPLQRKEIKLS